MNWNEKKRKTKQNSHFLILDTMTMGNVIYP